MAGQRIIPGPRALLDLRLAQGGDRPALSTSHAQLSSVALECRMRSAESVLREQGFDAQSILALVFPNSVEFVVWTLAAFRIGASVLPLNPRSSQPEWNDALQRSRTRFLASAGKSALEPDSEWRPVMSDGDVVTLWCRSAEPGEAPDTAGSSPLIRQFTSGSTGRPRSLVRDEPQIFEDYAHFMRGLDINASDRFLLIPPLYHAFGMLGLLAGLASGGEIYILDRFLPAEVIRVAKAFRPTVVFATPVMAEMLGKCFLPEEDTDAFASVRHFVCSTDRLKKSVRDVFVERFGTPLRVQYGSTETLSATIDVADDFVEGRVGRPYPGVELRIFGEQGEALDAGIAGRVGIKSPAAAREYADDFSPGLQLIDGYVIPGDRGFIDEAGDLHVVGRDGIYNIGGWKVDPLEVSSVISAALNVSHVAVLPFSRAGQSAIRVIIESSDPSLTAEQVLALCRASLADYKVPAKVDIYASLARDENGKVRLSALPAEPA